jgi:hypothetical protein
MKTNRDDLDKLKNMLKAKQVEQFESVMTRRTKNGKIYQNRQEIIEKYRNSFLPYPIAPLLIMDYCRDIFMKNIQNCFFFAGPLSLLSAYARNKEVRLKGFRAMSFSYLVSHYIFINIICMGLVTIDCLLFCDYCKPWSAIYNVDNDSEYFRQELIPKIQKEKASFDVQMIRTRNQGLKDEEL